MNSAEYPYSQGNRLEQRNTYFYSEFHGTHFMDAWRDARKFAARELRTAQSEAVEVQSKQAPGSGGIDTESLLGRLLAELLAGKFSDETRVWTNILRTRFTGSTGTETGVFAQKCHRYICRTVVSQFRQFHRQWPDRGTRAGA